ncbi:MAG: aldo/keto reductase [Bacteroidales bacterium]|jgi:uncharacterized protein|nr:aldo/keto reductase [Bacteroidales bacterium]
MSEDKNNISRREFFKVAGGGAAITAAVALTGCNRGSNERGGIAVDDKPTGSMTYRINASTGDKISILGYGCMRWPTINNESARENDGAIDQETVNELVDYAIEHGVNYFDTSPSYCKGQSEHATGIALSRHPRNSYYIATKLSNFAQATWSREGAMKMYYNSFKELQVDYIDYMLLHAVGQGGMENLNSRYIDNGMLDFLLEEREAGRIRNLGFSYHGDVEVFDYLLSQNDKYHWNFVQIQMNYVDWQHAKDVNKNNTNAEYLYNELLKLNIPVVIMEPLLGGRLANLPNHLAVKLKQHHPNSSVASWAFRYAGSFSQTLTVLSGMTYMEHLQDNVRTFSPLEVLSEKEIDLLEDTARMMIEYPLVPCTSCKYCMPCPYGIDIPSIFAHYNKCVNEDKITETSQNENYRKARREFLIGLDRKVPKLRQAAHCVGCSQCSPHCPQNINIPKELQRIDKYTNKLHSETLTFF